MYSWTLKLCHPAASEVWHEERAVTSLKDYRKTAHCTASEEGAAALCIFLEFVFVGISVLKRQR